MRKENSQKTIKPLDFVRTKSGAVGLVTEVTFNTYCINGKDVKRPSASVAFLECFQGLKTAWWHYKEIEVVDSLPNLLARKLMKGE